MIEEKIESEEIKVVPVDSPFPTSNIPYFSLESQNYIAKTQSIHVNNGIIIHPTFCLPSPVPEVFLLFGK
jgi:hypothetical protein